MADWDALLTLLRNITAALEELTGIEQAKTQAVVHGNREAVEQCMKKEQTMSLKLRGFDKKRDVLLQKLNMSGVPLKNIMDHCPDGAEEETREVSGALRRQYAIFQSASQVAQDALECNLHIIEKILEQANGGVPVQQNPRGSTNFTA